MGTFSDFKSISILIFACRFYRPVYEKKFIMCNFPVQMHISSSIEVNRFCS